MDSDEPADDHIVFDHDVTPECCSIRDDIMVTQDAVVGDMAIHHQ